VQGGNAPYGELEHLTVVQDISDSYPQTDRPNRMPPGGELIDLQISRNFKPFPTDAHTQVAGHSYFWAVRRGPGGEFVHLENQ
jgi:hypothetical protein